MNELRITNWNIQAMTGYEPLTTFYTDFSIADNFGLSAIKDTYKRAFAAWKDDVKYLTELVMVLNWKTFEHYGKNETVAQLYQDLFFEAAEYAENTLTGDDLAYYYKKTD